MSSRDILVIFDCDGTLVDSELLCNEGLVRMLKEYSLEADAKELMLRFRGGKLQEILDKLEELFEITLDDNFVERYREVVSRLFEEQLKPCNGVPQFLGRYKGDVCVASSGPREKIEQALRLTNLYRFFENRIFSSYEIKSWKPDPGIFLKAAKSMGYESNNCIVVEDSEKGIAAARAASMLSVYYNPGLNRIFEKPSFEINEMGELDNVLQLVNNISSN